MTLEDLHELEEIVLKQYLEVRSASSRPAIQQRLSENETNLLEAIRIVRELAIQNGMIERKDDS